MKNLNNLANDMLYGDIVSRIAKERQVGLTEARSILAQMSFKDYQIAEQGVAPPSGNAIGPTTQPAQNNQPNRPGQNPSALPPGAKGIWVKGMPPQQGMVVSVKGRNGVPIPGTISTVDMGKNGVVVKNPETNKEQMMDINTLEPFMVSSKPATPLPGTPQSQTAQSAATAQVGQIKEDEELNRLLELAGISENCSGGATGAGAIAMSAAPMGKMKKREYPEESLEPEYTAKTAKTIVGDTKPNQASGKLSADLAKSGKVTASRINNGRKRVR